MIHELYSNKPNYFNHISFNKGINIILADGNDNLEENSRNGLGKTTMINIIHFCLGAQKNEDLPMQKLSDWEFTIVIDLFDEKITATRSFKNTSIITVKGDFDNFPIKPNYSKENKTYFYPIKSWTTLLGQSLFNLKIDDTLKIKPSFRMLISYFIRRTDTDFKKPFKTASTSIKPIYSDLCTCLFLGLNWRLISKYRELNDENKDLTKNKKNIKESYGTMGELRPEINRLKKDVENYKSELDNFEILESYSDFEKEANKLTEELHELYHKRSILNKKLKQYEDSITSEETPEIDIEKIYNEVNFYFNENIKKTLNESKKFHENIILNRKKFLESEILSVQNELSEIEDSITQKSKQRSKSMDVLNNFGALHEYTAIQNKYITKKQNLEELESIIEKYETITFKKQKIKSEKIEIEDKIQLDYLENKSHLDNLINLFSENSSKLYDVPGDLVIDTIDKGFEFEIKIPKSKSLGKSKMMTFCYDLMLLETFYDENLIDFLVHDSNIFDGVDSRQYGNSLNLINEKCQEKDLQYICMLNSDSIPKDKINFDLDEKIILKLTDEKIEDSLLGFEFVI